MLSEVLKASVSSRGKIPRSDRLPGLSCSGLFPCPYFLYKVQIGEVWDEELTAQQIPSLGDNYAG